MSEVIINQLSTETVKLITSTQIITSVSTAVKELLENSVDADAKIIQVRLENYGLDLIEVKDNGSGVSYDNVRKMFLPGYTSKIHQFDDLYNLSTYGFRGEALAALCKVAKLTITTKTSSDSLAMTYIIDSQGSPVSSKPSHLNEGTLLSISDLFYNLPVRRLFLSSKKKLTEELKKTEHIVQCLSLIHPDLNVSLIHNKCVVWKKNPVKGIKQSFMQVVGLKSVSKMDHINKSVNQVTIDLIIPKKGLENVDNVFTNSPHSVFTYINKRPVTLKNLSQPVQEHIYHHYKNLVITYRYAVCLISIRIPPTELDINLEPNKTKAFLKNQIDLVKMIDNILSNYYGNENFHCTALKETMIKDEEEVDRALAAIPVDDPPDEHISKKPRLQMKTSDKSVGEKRNDEFLEKNKSWNLEIINDDCTINKDIQLQNYSDNENSMDIIDSNPQTLCSQINKNNCMFTTADEVTRLNAVLNETNFNMVISTNSKNSTTRLLNRHNVNSTQSSENVNIPEWPIRPKVVQIPSDGRPEGVEDNLQENNSINDFEKTSSNENIDEGKIENANSESDGEKWSSEMIEAMKSDKTDVDVAEFLEDGQDISKFDLSMRSISSQMGKKEMKAFTKFARLMRPKIIQEFPKLMFTQVAAILAERWKALTPNEVKHYEKMASVVETGRKGISREAEKQSRTSGKGNNVNSLIEQIKKKNKLNRPPRTEITFVTSLNSIEKIRDSCEGMKNCDENELRIIGQLRPSNNWLYKRGKEIGHLRHKGLQEIATYQKMLSDGSVPTKSLEKPIFLCEKNLGATNLNTLISLDYEYCSDALKFVITSELITKNGFKIEIDKVGDLVLSVNITEIASPIPQFGISDLTDALELYQNNKEGDLSSWRPTSVQSYFKNEAVRLFQNSVVPDRLDVEDMLNFCNPFSSYEIPVCLHSKEIFVPIYHIQEEHSS